MSGSTKTSADQNEKDEEVAKVEEVVEQRESFTGSKSKPVTLLQVDGGHKKKMVRFKLQEDDNVGGGSTEGDSRSGVVRIRVVVTLKELKQILDSKESSKYSSVEELVREMNLKGRRICRSRTSYGPIDNSQGPALESISELH